MNSNTIRLYTTNKVLEKRTDLQKDLLIFTSVSTFKDDTWDLNKIKKSENMIDSSVSLYFTGIPAIYKDIVKYFIIVSLTKGKSYSVTNTQVYSLGIFFNYVFIECNMTPVGSINKSTLLNFEMYLHGEKELAKSTKEAIWSSINMFFKTMASWEGMSKTKVVNNMNPFSRTSLDRLNVQKYIPLKIINEIDKVFYNKNVKHHIRTIYWICRLIPSRINEVTTIPINCLKKYRENEYTLTLHMYKQNGGYIEPELRVIHLKYKDMGKNLIDLIKEQQDIAQSLQGSLLEEKKDFLFTYTAKKDHVALLTAETVRKEFNGILELYNVVDEKNNIYKLTPHQLRHNAITDRIYEGFSLLEIRDMTAHKSNAMLEGSYIHPEKQQLKALGEKINLENEPAGGVYFKGKIINADNPLVVKRLLAKPRSHKIGRLGICSDITGCKNDMFECFSCLFFVPNADELDYFKEQAEQWENKVSITAKNSLMKENAEYNLELSKTIVGKIEDAIKVGVEDEEETSGISYKAPRTT